MAREIPASLKMEEAYDLSAKELIATLKGEKDVTDLTKIAVTAAGIYVKMKSVEGHGEALKYQVMRDISADKKELKQYINSSMPEISPVKRLR